MNSKNQALSFFSYMITRKILWFSMWNCQFCWSRECCSLVNS